MFVLRIQHAIRDFDRWRSAFESDPIGRERMGVRRYRILRPIDDPLYVMIDLEFETAAEAEACRGALGALWDRVDVALRPQARTVESVEIRDY